jgi:hypothetical protein
MNIDNIPKDVEPLIVLGADSKEYLVVYTTLGNAEVIEMLYRTLSILEMEEEASGLTKH